MPLQTPRRLITILLMTAAGCGAAVLAPTSRAADTRDTACRTTAECLAEVAKIQGIEARDATSSLAKAQDQFYWLGRINMASTVMTVEQKIIPPELVAPIARGVAHAIDQATQPGGKRPSDVLQVEKIISDVAGPEATLIHSGRSRQDMYASIRTAQLRLELLDFADALDAARTQLLELADKHVETLVPAYTNGVQAMPVSYAHYLLAFADSFARDAQRLREIWARVNRSAMGTAVLANSSWPLDRERLASLLGFDGLIVNSYDAGQVSTYDVPIEAANIAGSVAIRIGAMMQDVHIQYHQTRPWLLLAPDKTYTSSAMPQKRNPGVIQNTRGKASDVVASAQWVTLRAHNVSPGMTDYKQSWDAGKARTFILGVEMMRQFTDVIGALRIDPKRSLEELEVEWTTSMELAETLQRAHGIPFRVGHHFASEIVSHARDNQLEPKAFPYAQAQRIYTEAGKKYDLNEPTLPLDEPTFRRTLSPRNMVDTRVGIGGPQPDEVRRMLSLAREQLQVDRAWVNGRRTRLAEADAKLNQAFAALLAR